MGHTGPVTVSLYLFTFTYRPYITQTSEGKGEVRVGPVYAMKTWRYGGIAPLIRLLSSRVEQWAPILRPLCSPGKEHTVRHEYALFVRRASQDILKKRNIPCLCKELNLSSSVKQLVALRLYRCFTSAPYLLGR